MSALSCAPKFVVKLSTFLCVSVDHERAVLRATDADAARQQDYVSVDHERAVLRAKEDATDDGPAMGVSRS